MSFWANRSSILSCALPLAVSLGARAQIEARLEHRLMPEPPVLPAPAWRAGDGAIPIRHRDGEGWRAFADGMSLSVDTDGDGRYDAEFKGQHSLVTLRGRYADGTRMEYSVRVRTGQGARFSFACGSARVGTLAGVPVQVIDQNCNGTFDEVGVDALVVGGAGAASFLSRIVNLRGKLYELTVDADGRRAVAVPYDGPSGVLALRRGLALHGELRSAVMNDLGDKWSFEVAEHDAVRVPVGVYVFTAGVAERGGDSAKLRAGHMHPLVVNDGATVTLEWGLPLRAEFEYTRTGDRVTVGSRVRYFGRAGEEWLPPIAPARTPKLMVFDAGERTESALFDTC